MQNDTPTYPNWFESVALKNFQNYLTKFKDKPDLKFVQIGAFTGDASVWLAKHILTDPTSKLLDIDTWQGSDEVEHRAMDFEDVYFTYQSKVKPYVNVADVRAESGHILPQMSSDSIDFIYVDGDHTAAGVRIDAYHSHRLLKSGGILAFDDYKWGEGLDPEVTPKPAIDRFLESHADEYTILGMDWQVWLEKK